MNLGNNIFGLCGRFNDESDAMTLLPDVLATNLLLFDKFIMVSCLLKEFPLMIDQFGLSSTIDLLKSDALTINCDPSQIVMIGSTDEAVRKGRLFDYDVAIIRTPDHREYMDSCFKDILKKVRFKSIDDFIMLKTAILRRLDRGARSEDLLTRPESKASRALVSHLENNFPTIKRAVISQLNELGKTNISPKDFSLVIHRIEQDKFKAETNIKDVFRLSDLDSHDVIQKAILSLGSAKQTFAYMAEYSAICSLNDRELTLFDEELRFYAEASAPGKIISQLNRVLDIKGFPNFQTIAETGDLRLDRILELRETREIREFRAWLSGIALASEKEIKEQLESTINHIGTFLPTKKGKSLKILVSTGLGLLPGGTMIGAVASFFESFMVEKLFPQSGPISFVNNMLPTVYDLKNRAKVLEKRGKVLGLD
jgi:hypothetical protein